MKRRIMLVAVAILYANPAVPAVFAEESVRNLVISQSAEVLDNNVTTFTDLKGYEWAVPAIEAMSNKGVISGIGNNKYAPGNNVTRVEFASMAIRAVGGGTEAIESLANEAGNISEIESLNGNFWGNSTISASDKIGLTGFFGKDKESWNEPASRAEMAYIVMTVAEQLGEEEFEVKEGIENNIGDYEAVRKKSSYLRSIVQAYSNGIISGMNDRGDFVPDGTARRAEAAVMMWRLIEPSQRANVVVKEKEVVQQPIQQENNVMPDGTVYPKEGDIGPDGRPITRDPETGVLGYGNGQKGGIYLNTVLANGTTLQVGNSLPHQYDGIDGYYVERNGYTYFSSEWRKIDNTVKAKLNITNPASSSNVGLQADIEGNIIQPGSNAIPMYEVKPNFDIYMWNQVN